MVKSSQLVGANIDEFDHAALFKMAGQKISAPLVECARPSGMCLLYHIDLPENGNGSHSVMVLGHIVIILMIIWWKTGGWMFRFQPVSRLGYMDYANITDIYEMTLSEKCSYRRAVLDIYPNIAAQIIRGFLPPIANLRQG